VALVAAESHNRASLAVSVGVASDLQAGPVVLNFQGVAGGREGDAHALGKLSHRARAAAAAPLRVPTDVEVAGHGHRGQEREGRSHGREGTGKEHDEKFDGAEAGLLA
jgi:hypothetical protein